MGLHTAHDSIQRGRHSAAVFRDNRISRLVRDSTCWTGLPGCLLHPAREICESLCTSSVISPTNGPPIPKSWDARLCGATGITTFCLHITSTVWLGLRHLEASDECDTRCKSAYCLPPKLCFFAAVSFWIRTRHWLHFHLFGQKLILHIASPANGAHTRG